MARRKTNKEFEKEVYELVKDEYTFLEEYVTSKTKIEVKHNTCSHEWKVQPNEFLRGSRCPKCSMKFKRSGSKRKTHEQFTVEVCELVGDEYIFLDKYKNYMTPLKVKHSVCGKSYDVTPSEFFQGRRCPFCSSVAKKTTEEFKREVEDVGSGRYILLSKYINDLEKVTIKHIICGHVYKVKPTNFIQGQRCPNCRYEKVSKKTRRTQDEFEGEIYELVGDEYTVLGEYLGSKEKIEIQHNECEYVQKVSPDTFLESPRCPVCSPTGKRIPEKFERDIIPLVGDEYIVKTPYEEEGAKIKVIHNVCNHEYLVDRNEFMRGSRCPKCRESKGERTVADCLYSKGITHEREYTFDNLTSRGHLRFDFALLDARGCVYALIEYDGIQHFKEVSIWGGEEGLIKRQYRDNLKDEYCLSNGIPLLRIPYWEINNIDNILDEFLSKRGDYLCQV